MNRLIASSTIAVVGLGFLPFVMDVVAQERGRRTEEAAPDVPHDRIPVSVHVVIVEYLGGEGTEIDGVDSLAKIQKWIEVLDDQKALLSLTRITVSTVDRQQSLTQFGERAAIETGRTRRAVPRVEADVDVDDARRRGFAQALPARNVAVSYNYEELGTLVRATPRVTDDGEIAVNLQIERSALSSLRLPVDLEMDAVGQVPPPTIVRLAAESTLRLRDGQTRTAYRKSATSPQGLVETVVLVTATIQNASAEAPPHEAPAPGQP